MSALDRFHCDSKASKVASEFHKSCSHQLEDFEFEEAFAQGRVEALESNLSRERWSADSAKALLHVIVERGFYLFSLQSLPILSFIIDCKLPVLILPLMSLIYNLRVTREYAQYCAYRGCLVQNRYEIVMDSWKKPLQWDKGNWVGGYSYLMKFTQSAWLVLNAMNNALFTCSL